MTWCSIVLYHLFSILTESMCRTDDHTFLKAVKVAIHLAFAPHIRNSENSKPSRMIAGWMSPFTTWPTGFGSPKCVNIRSPRDAPAPSSSPAEPTFTSLCIDVFVPPPLLPLASPAIFFCDGVEGCFDFDGGAAPPVVAEVWF